MEGKFLRKKFNGWLFMLFVCGLLSIGLYIFINIVDSKATSGTLTFLIMGVLIVLVVISSWMLNRGASIRIDNDSIKAKYHWFGRIDCRFSDVEFAMAQINTLIIQLKDGKTHTIMGIENSWQLTYAIRQNMPFELTESVETLIEELNILRSTRKKGLVYVCSSIALMFIVIFVTLFLIGEREMYEFTHSDWTVFAIMCVIEAVITIATLFFANKTGKCNVPIEKMQYLIRRKIIETQPLVPGYVKEVYTDINYTARITLFGSPSNSSVYYSVQQFDANYNLLITHTTDAYDSQEELADVFEMLINITDKVLH